MDLIQGTHTRWAHFIYIAFLQEPFTQLGLSAVVIGKWGLLRAHPNQKHRRQRQRPPPWQPATEGGICPPDSMGSVCSSKICISLFKMSSFPLLKTEITGFPQSLLTNSFYNVCQVLHPHQPTKNMLGLQPLVMADKFPQCVRTVKYCRTLTAPDSFPHRNRSQRSSEHVYLYPGNSVSKHNLKHSKYVLTVVFHLKGVLYLKAWPWWWRR